MKRIMRSSAFFDGHIVDLALHNGDDVRGSS